MLTLGPNITVTADPRALAERVVDILDGAPTRRASGWAEAMSGLAATPIRRTENGVPEYLGRACCYAHLSAFDGQWGTSIDLPFVTTCQRCQREFRVTLGVTAGG